MPGTGLLYRQTDVPASGPRSWRVLGPGTLSLLARAPLSRYVQSLRVTDRPPRTRRPQPVRPENHPAFLVF